MAEQLVNEFTVNRPIDQAWAVITDVERIAPCLPGAQLQEIEGDVYRGIVKIKLGSVTPQFKGQASFIERDDAAHTATLKAEGRDTGGRGNASAEIAAQAESLSPTSTRVVVTTDLHITGKVAQFGRGIIGDVSKKLMAQFAGNLNTMLDAEPDGTNADAPAAAAEDTKSATDPSPAESALGSDTPRAAAPAAAEPPKVRKIDSPASEPVDLAGMAGPAILKRLAPVVVGMLLLLFILRRRRR
jgi:carbon monoxide dehydrogenase subunit G